VITLKNYQKFIVYWIANFLLLYLATSLLPGNYVFGNSIFTPVRAMLFTSFIWNIAIWKAESIFKEMELDFKDNMSMMLEYLVLNFATLWLTSRFSFIFGFGVGSYLYVLALAFVANLVQYFVWMKVDKK
jgi:O-antigen/teichoic acid export membrane protein